MGEEKEIRVSGLEFAYPGEEPGMPGHIVLRGLDLQIPRGQFVAVLGHNGSGKSTLAKHFNAILLPTSGDVVVCGINTKRIRMGVYIYTSVCATIAGIITTARSASATT